MDVRNTSVQQIAALTLASTPIAMTQQPALEEKESKKPDYPIQYTGDLLPVIDESKIVAALFLDWDGTLIFLREKAEDPIVFINIDKIKKLFLDAMANHIAIHIVTAMKNVPDFLIAELSKLGIINQQNEKLWRSRLHFVLNDEEHLWATHNLISADQIGMKKRAAIEDLLLTKYKSLSRDQFRFADDWTCNCNLVGQLIPTVFSTGKEDHIDNLITYIEEVKSLVANNKNLAEALKPKTTPSIDPGYYTLADLPDVDTLLPAQILPSSVPTSLSNGLFTLFTNGSLPDVAEEKEEPETRNEDHSLYPLAQALFEHIDCILHLLQKFQHLDVSFIKEFKDRTMLWPLKRFAQLLNLLEELREFSQTQKDLPVCRFFQECKAEVAQEKQLREQQQTHLKKFLNIMCAFKFPEEERPNLLQILQDQKNQLIAFQKALYEMDHVPTVTLEAFAP